MADTPKRPDAAAITPTGSCEGGSLASSRPDLKDPGVVLSLLEADQVVAAKRQTHFGRRRLSFGTRALLWGLRIYVVIMLAIVLISVLRALHPTP